MSTWWMAAIALTFFGLAWAVDALWGTAALVLFNVVMLVGPIVALEGWRQVRSRLT